MLEGLPVGGISAGALVGIVVLLVLVGRLVPRQQLLDLREDRDKWQAAATDWQKAYYELGMAVQESLEQGRATVHALTEIQEALEHRPEFPR